jgi:hypothetical protein
MARNRRFSAEAVGSDKMRSHVSPVIDHEVPHVSVDEVWIWACSTSPRTDDALDLHLGRFPERLQALLGSLLLERLHLLWRQAELLGSLGAGRR